MGDTGSKRIDCVMVNPEAVWKDGLGEEEMGTSQGVVAVDQDWVK